MNQYTSFICSTIAAALTVCATAETVNAPDTVAVSVTLRDKSVIAGEMPPRDIKVTTSFDSRMKIPLAAVQSIAFEETKAGVRQDKITFVNNDVLTVSLRDPSFLVTTLLGELKIDTDVIGKIEFSQPGKTEGLVFACSFERLDDVLGSSRRKYQLVEGKRGNALRINGDFNVKIKEFEAGEFPERAGTVEYWAKLHDPTDKFSWAARFNPRFFLIKERDVINGFHYIALCSNNGRGSSGICATVPHVSFGTHSFFDKSPTSYEGILGSTWQDWNHYALVWDVDGIDGITTPNGEKAVVAVFFNGKLNSSVSNLNRGNRKNVIAYEVLLQDNAMDHTHPNTFSIDEFKIWDYAKTTFELN